MKIHHPTEHIHDANEALQMLKDGNERFLAGKPIHKVYCNIDREVYSFGQKPFAVVITCSDSRVAPEIFFDQNLGDIFIIRNAGNIVDKVVLGSMEYAIEYLETRLVVVCGHSYCGAVKAACSSDEFPPKIKHIIEYIKPAAIKGGDMDEIIRRHVEYQVAHIKNDAIVKRLKIMVAGAHFDIRSGAVKWF